MKIKLSIFIILFSISFLKAQRSKLIPLLINQDTSNYSIFDSTIFYWKKKSPEKKLNRERIIFLNNIPVDTVELYFTYPRYIFKKILLENKDSNSFYHVTTKGLLKLNTKNYKHSFYTPNNYFLTNNFKEVEFFISSERTKNLVNLSKYLCNEIPCYGFDDDETIEEIFQLNEYAYLIRVCSGDIVCIYNRYFYLDIRKNKIENITKRIKKFSEAKIADTELTRIQFASKNSKFFRGYINKFCGDPIDTFNVKSYLFNEELEISGRIMTMGSYNSNSFNPVSISGVNIQNGKIINFFIFSSTDDNKNVSIFYNFNPEFEVLFYKIYHNIMINKNELALFELFDLNILKNLIYAKHNYKFSSEFYQAYFNLYSFYNDYSKKKSRKEIVDNSLSTIDFQNLNLIQNFIKDLDQSPR